jgi:hypothetical protein
VQYVKEVEEGIWKSDEIQYLSNHWKIIFHLTPTFIRIYFNLRVLNIVNIYVNSCNTTYSYLHWLIIVFVLSIISVLRHVPHSWLVVLWRTCEMKINSTPSPSSSNYVSVSQSNVQAGQIWTGIDPPQLPTNCTNTSDRLHYTWAYCFF